MLLSGPALHEGYIELKSCEGLGSEPCLRRMESVNG